MGASQRFALSDVAGGINEGANRTDINDNEMAELVNWFPYTVRLKRRNGTRRVSSALASPNGRYFENITNAFAYKQALGMWRLLVGGRTSIGKLDGSALVQIPQHFSESPFPDSSKPWDFEIFKDIAYAVRKGGTGLQRTEGSFVTTAGIAAPTSVVTLADGGVGNLAAGDFLGVVTFFNSITAAESNPNPNSNKLTLGAGRFINWSGIPISSNPQVNARRLWRTLPNGDGVYFLVGTLNNNFSTTFVDNVIQAEQGVQVSFDNGLPPANPEMIAIWLDRAWLSDGRDVFFSEFLLPEAYSEFSTLSINPDDGHRVRGLLNFGDRLFVGKSNAVHFITTIDGFSFRVQTLSNEHGVFSHGSMKAAEGFAFWFGGDNFYQTDGNTVRAIGDVKLRNTIDALNPATYDEITAAIDETNGWYIVTLPSVNKMAVYMYRLGVWTTFDIRAADNALVTPGFIADFVDTNDKAVLYCNIPGGDADSIFQFNDPVTLTDDGRRIECRLTSKSFGFTEEQTLKIAGHIVLQVTPVAEDITITLKRDDDVLLAGPATLNLFSDKQWFRVPLATNAAPATNIALVLQYTGTKALDVLGFGMTITDLERQVPVSEKT